jgi:hypothetical protein
MSVFYPGCLSAGAGSEYFARTSSLADYRRFDRLMIECQRPAAQVTPTRQIPTIRAIFPKLAATTSMILYCSEPLSAKRPPGGSRDGRSRRLVRSSAPQLIVTLRLAEDRATTISGGKARRVTITLTVPKNFKKGQLTLALITMN